jgi:threonine synthase
MRYVSTRGQSPALGFNEVLLAGLAPDGGLYVPDAGCQVPDDRKSAGSYAELASRIMRPFVGDDIPSDVFNRLVGEAYAGFAHHCVAPLRQLDQRLWLMELFHGPTLAFKDVALQLLGRLFGHVLARQGRRVTIVGATSGDTGSAAIEAFRGSDTADIFILLPHGRVSDVQRRQMTTVDAANVHVIAIEGSFDDCQDLVKTLFADHAFRDRVSMSAVNSINWARIMAQIVYYAAAAQALPGQRLAFSIPSGNFGNAYAAHCARSLGVTMERIIVASNANDVLTRTIASGRIGLEAVVPTLSPAMDIQVPSNFERLMFELYDRDGGELSRDMARLRRERALSLSPPRAARLASLFEGHRVSDEDTLRSIAAVHRSTGMLVDPHTAIGIRAAQQAKIDPDIAVVALATAHAAKFPEAVVEATGIVPELPPNLSDLMTRKERFTVMPNDPARLMIHIVERISQ